MRNCKQKFIENLKTIMNEKKISQAQLASKISVDQTTVSAWLRGESEPTLTKICLILDFLSCTFDDLIE